MKIENIIIKETTIADFEDIMNVETLAFGSEKEAELTANLLNDKSAEPILSLLAFYNSEAIGHILFTRIYLEGETPQPLMHLLAPLAVKPLFQSKGVGGMLIKRGLEILKERGSDIVFVLGHMEYYPKHGFVPDAESLGFIPPYPIPKIHANAWMVQSLNSSFEKYKGKMRCADQLQREEYWRE